MIFLLTTNPSEFAASINRVGCNYKAAYALSLTLRYFPDTIRNYQDIALATAEQRTGFIQEGKARNEGEKRDEYLCALIFSTLDRIELISNAMDLRGFGKKKNRTWYVAKH